MTEWQDAGSLEELERQRVARPPAGTRHVIVAVPTG